jgi:hypothetical protein
MATGLTSVRAVPHGWRDRRPVRHGGDGWAQRADGEVVYRLLEDIGAQA